MAEQDDTEKKPVTVRVPVDKANPLTHRHEEFVEMPADAAQDWDERLWRQV